MHLGFLNFSFFLFYLFLFLFVFVGVCFRGGEICNYHYNIASSCITKNIYIYIKGKYFYYYYNYNWIYKNGFAKIYLANLREVGSWS